jgi:hypothetical protein
MLKTVISSAIASGIAVVTTTKAYAQGFGAFFPSAFQGVGGGSLDQLIQTIINVILLIAGIVAVIYLIVGGYQYITSSGNAEQAQAGRTTVLNAIIGLVIIFAAYLIVRFVLDRIVGYTPSA